jgi:hypothetical protein
MGHGGFGRGSYDKELAGILNGNNKYLVAFIVKDKDSNVNLLGEYELFKDLNVEEIRKYSKEFEELNKVKLSRIEIWTLTLSEPKQMFP